MATTTFTDNITPMPASWLNDVDQLVYGNAFNVRNDPYLALGDGTTDDRASVLAAQTAAALVSGAIVFPPGTYKFAADTTLSSPVVLMPGAILAPANTKILTISGNINAPAVAIFGGSGTVTIGRTNNVEGWIEWFPNADYGDKIIAALAACSQGPFTWKYATFNQTFTSKIVATSASCITVTPGVIQNITSNAGKGLIWAGGASSGNALDISGSRSFHWLGGLSYNSAAYDGDLIKCGSGAGTYHPKFSGYYGGSDGICGAASIFSLDTMLGMDIGNASFAFTKRVTRCAAGSNNCVDVGISGRVWVEKTISVAAFEGRGTNWNFGNVIWESFPDTAVTSISNASPAVVTLAAHGLVADWPVKFTTTGALPTGLTVGTQYYVLSAGLTTSTFRVSTSVGGAAVNTSSAGSGTHSMCPAVTKAFSIDTECDNVTIGGAFDDGGSGGGTLIDLSGGISKSTFLHNPCFGAGSGTAVKCSTTAGNTSVLTGTGRIGNMTIGIETGRAHVIDVVLDNLATTPWNGVEPTKTRITNNLHGVGNSGVPVALNAVINITLPGDADDGFGMVLVQVTQSGGAVYQATFMLDGAGTTARESSDPANKFSSTVDTGSSINIYWLTTSYVLQNKNAAGEAITAIVRWL